MFKEVVSALQVEGMWTENEATVLQSDSILSQSGIIRHGGLPMPLSIVKSWNLIKKSEEPYRFLHVVNVRLILAHQMQLAGSTTDDQCVL